MTDAAMGERPLLAGVCGFPINHSRSPLLFAHWFREHGIAGHYVPLRIAPDDFDRVVRALSRAGFRGVNVTVPHKQAALAIATGISPAARAVGAANTITFGEGGAIEADNSDAYGFLANLRAGAPGWRPASGPAVILGAGGAARAAAHVLLEAGAPSLRIANRTRARAEELACHFGPRLEVLDWSAREAALDGAATIVNATSLGMIGKPPLDLRLDAAPVAALVTDMVYTPLVTPLLAQARARGMPAVDGLGMLLHQARPGFRAWFGRDPEVTEALRAACLAGT
jgi:shikimate dehydrogenase